jgi:lysophospholipase L1-like esterase
MPETEYERLPPAQRIPNILQAELGPDFRVIDEALNGRMSAWDDPMNPDKNGLKQLPFLLDSHRPIDLLTLQLGTNDLKHYMHLTALDCALAQDALIDAIEAAHCGPSGNRPRILLIAPPLIVDTANPVRDLFAGAVEKSLAFAEAYRKIADKRQCLFFNAADVVKTSGRDGIHLEAEEHRKQALAMAEIIRNAFRA